MQLFMMKCILSPFTISRQEVTVFNRLTGWLDTQTKLALEDPSSLNNEIESQYLGVDGLCVVSCPLPMWSISLQNAMSINVGRLGWGCFHYILFRNDIELFSGFLLEILHVRNRRPRLTPEAIGDSVRGLVDKPIINCFEVQTKIAARLIHLIPVFYLCREFVRDGNFIIIAQLLQLLGDR
ncbi:MAG: hypothetical protein U0Z26_09500 [Anaerolineales bacterium]